MNERVWNLTGNEDFSNWPDAEITTWPTPHGILYSMSWMNQTVFSTYVCGSSNVPWWDNDPDWQRFIPETFVKIPEDEFGEDEIEHALEFIQTD